MVKHLHAAAGTAASHLATICSLCAHREEEGEERDKGDHRYTCWHATPSRAEPNWAKLKHTASHAEVGAKVHFFKCFFLDHFIFVIDSFMRVALGRAI